MTPLTAMIFILIFQILSYTVIILVDFVPKKKPKKEEVDIEKQTKEASKIIAEYCLCQVDEGHCIFNRNEKNVDGCDCVLMDNPPEAWPR